jgi:hypothetical protein
VSRLERLLCLERSAAGDRRGNATDTHTAERQRE